MGVPSFIFISARALLFAHLRLACSALLMDYQTAAEPLLLRAVCNISFSESRPRTGRQTAASRQVRRTELRSDRSGVYSICQTLNVYHAPGCRQHFVAYKIMQQNAFPATHLVLVTCDSRVTLGARSDQPVGSRALGSTCTLRAGSLAAHICPHNKYYSPSKFIILIIITVRLRTVRQAVQSAPTASNNKLRSIK